MITVQLRDIEDYLYECETVIDKANRVAHGVNQGRTVHKDKNYYYKVFHKDYCRRENFIRAYEAGFFEDLAPALHSIIENNGGIVGYITEAGTPLGNEFAAIPKDFYESVLDKARETGMFFYDLVASNIVITDKKKLSLIDLESIYYIDELHTIDKHKAVVKPDYYFLELEKIW